MIDGRLLETAAYTGGASMLLGTAAGVMQQQASAPDLTVVGMMGVLLMGSVSAVGLLYRSLQAAHERSVTRLETSHRDAIKARDDQLHWLQAREGARETVLASLYDNHLALVSKLTNEVVGAIQGNTAALTRLEDQTNERNRLASQEHAAIMEVQRAIVERLGEIDDRRREQREFEGEERRRQAGSQSGGDALGAQATGAQA